MKPITAYCKQEVAGWMPNPVGDMFPEQAGFLNLKDGIQFTASTKDLGRLKVIHVSVGLFRHVRPDLTEQEHLEFALKQTPQIIYDFFGERGFAMQPDDERRPTVKHYFSILEEGEE